MHFFTEPTIPSQDSISAIPYGPLSGSEETDFVTGSEFTFSSPTKAFACQKGMLFIQESLLTDRINIILKPIDSPKIDFSPVKYYIYRGLLKDSFLNGTDIRPKGTSESEFINKFWKNWEDYKDNTNQPSLPDPSPKSIGYDITLPNTVNVESIFNNTQGEVQAVLVDEGDWLGNFGDTQISSFEIIIDTDHFEVNLDFLRKSSSSIIADTIPITPEEIFNDKIEREKILSFIDPAAFFGMHYTTGVKISTYPSGNKQTETKKRDNLYNEIITKFATRNRVYIDIRSERGYSYNFYGNYGNTNNHLLKLKAQSAPGFIEDLYYTNKWPIFFDSNSIEPNNKLNKLEIQLRIDDNIKPLLFLRNPKLRGGIRKRHFVNEEKLLDSTLDWSKSILLQFPNTGTSPSKVNVAWHVQLQYLRQDESATDGNIVPKNTIFLDCLFPNIELPHKEGSLDVFQHLQSSKYTLINDDDFAYISQSGIYKDVDDVVFYAQSEYAYIESSGVFSIASSIKKAQSTPLTSSPVFPKSIKLQRITVKEGTDNVFVIAISNVNRFGKASKRESLFLLGLTNNELTTISDAANLIGLVEGHSKNIVFSNETQIQVTGEIPYKKYELNVQGLKADGLVGVTTSTGVFVYTLDGRCFNSLTFGNQSNVTLGLPDPGTLSPWKYAGKWEYNGSILVSESLHPTGVISVDDQETNNYLSPLSIELRGIAFYPSDINSGTIDDISSPRPVLFIIHGNGQDYKDYIKLCKHLSKNGFVSVSISCLFNATGNQYINIIKLPPAYTPFTHYFRMDGKLYFYNNTPSDSGYQNIYILSGNDTSPVAVISNTKIVKNLIYGTDFTITIIPLPSDYDQLIFLKDFSKYKHGMAALGRSNVLYEHMKIIKSKFNSKISNNIGIIGHSRGGEAVVFAGNEILKTIPPNVVHTDLVAIDMDNLKSVISLAPTHQYSTLEHRLQRNTSYFVIYGSRDYDVSGAYLAKPDIHTSGNYGNFMSSGISLYDKSFDQEKSLLFVVGATHNGFITSNKTDLKLAKAFAWSYNKKDIESKSVQQNISLAYYNAHFRKNLYNEDFWLPLFTGDIKPDSVETDKSILSQYETNSSQNKLIKYPSSIYRSGSLSFTPSYNGTPSNMKIGLLRVNDGFSEIDLKTNGASPHYSEGITLRWETGRELKFDFPSTENVSSYDYLSFRIANMDLSKDLEGVKIGIESAGVIRYVELLRIARSDKRSDQTSDIGSGFFYNNDPTKHTMKTIRILLSQYSDLGINLSSVKAVSILFTNSGSGKISFDNLLFTK